MTIIRGTNKHKLHIKKAGGRVTSRSSFFLFTFFLLGISVSTTILNKHTNYYLYSSSVVSSPSSSNEHEQQDSTFHRPPDCNLQQLLMVRHQLIPDTCVNAIEYPFTQKCSLTQNTKCPDASNYLDEYYYELQQEYLEGIQKNNNDGMEPFIGLSVGCNKGFDALNTLRRGTFDASLSKDDWRMEMTKDGELDESVCVQNITLPFQVSPNIQLPRKGIVHCFEPVPSTVKRLQSASTHLGYDQKGYKVIHAAVSNVTGKAYFQSKFKAGRENGGLDDCRHNANGNRECDVQVEVLTLENYAKEHLVGNGPIHVLQIDVEGYDADVLLGAGKHLLERVEYLEFEYNWMGSWKKQHLYDVIEMLDEIGFTCYWAGKQQLWRVTGCWQLYFDVHTWSNLACANQKRVPRLAAKMENMFQMQLMDKGKGSSTLVSGSTMESAARSSTSTSTNSTINHEILSLDPAVMSSKYLSDRRIAGI